MKMFLSKYELMRKMCELGKNYTHLIPLGQKITFDGNMSCTLNESGVLVVNSVNVFTYISLPLIHQSYPVQIMMIDNNDADSALGGMSDFEFESEDGRLLVHFSGECEAKKSYGGLRFRNNVRFNPSVFMYDV